MPDITTAITDPEGTSITTGTLKFVATDTTSGGVLKNTYATVVPGTTITLLAGTYKVYFTDSDEDMLTYVGEIVVSINATLVSLLSN